MAASEKVMVIGLDCAAPELVFDRFAGKHAQALQYARNILQPAHIVMENGNTERFDHRQLSVRVAALPGYDQVGFERADALQIETIIAAHARDPLRGRGVIAKVDRTDYLGTRADGKQVFSQMRRQADDAPRRLGQRDGMAAIIDHAHCGLQQGRAQGD